MNSAATWSKPDSEHLPTISNQTLCCAGIWLDFLFSFHWCSATRDIYSHLRNTWKTHTWMYIQETPASRIANARTHPYRLAHTHNILHNRNGKDVCMRWQRLWFAVAVSARRKLKHSDDTRNTQINKLTKEEEKVERGREKSPNNKLSSGGSLGNIIQCPGKQWNYIYS